MVWWDLIDEREITKVGLLQERLFLRCGLWCVSQKLGCTNWVLPAQQPTSGPTTCVYIKLTKSHHFLFSLAHLQVSRFGYGFSQSAVDKCYIYNFLKYLSYCFFATSSILTSFLSHFSIMAASICHRIDFQSPQSDLSDGFPCNVTQGHRDNGMGGTGRRFSLDEGPSKGLSEDLNSSCFANMVSKRIK